MDREVSISKLRQLVTAALRHELPFAAFSRAYVDFFADNAADEYFVDTDHNTYGALFERLQWTVVDPSGLDRAVGYWTEAETLEWLKDRFPELASA